MKSSAIKFLTVAVLALGITPVFAADRAAVLILKSGGAAEAATCTGGGGELKFLVIAKPKINGKEEIRLLGNLRPASSKSAVSQSVYNSAKKIDFKSLQSLVWKGDVMYARQSGDPVVASPDNIKFERGSNVAMGDLYNVSIEGERRDGKNRTKEVMSLNRGWKIYFIWDGEAPEESLFRHAQEENTFPQWNAYLKTAKSSHFDEAIRGLESVVRTCVEASLNEFESGRSGALDEAEKLANAAIGISDSTRNQELLGTIRNAKRKFLDEIAEGVALMKAERWDQALDRWEPVSKFTKDPLLTAFAGDYQKTLESSHDLHLKVGDQKAASRGAGVRAWQEARTEYEIALKRKPGSPLATEGRKKMIIEITLEESKQLREAKHPADAREKLLATLKEFKNEPRLDEALKDTNCEYAKEIFNDVFALVGLKVSAPAKPVAAPKPAPAKAPPANNTKGPANAKGPGTPAAPPQQPQVIPVVSQAIQLRRLLTAPDKKQFREAREKMTFAAELCPSDECTKLLALLSTALSGYQFDLAQKAFTKKTYALALLYSSAALIYEPTRSDIQTFVEKAKESVRQSTHLQAGVVVTNTSGNQECQGWLPRIQSDAEAGLTGAGAVNVQLLAGDRAAQILRTVRSGGSQSNFAILSVAVTGCGIAVPNPTGRQVASKFFEKNPNYDALQNQQRDAERNYDACKNAPGATDQTCAQQKNYRDSARDHAVRESEYTPRDYFYQEVLMTAEGQLKLGLQIDDSISRGTRRVGEVPSGFSDSCTARRGVNEEKDQANFGGGGGGVAGLLGTLLNRGRTPAPNTGPVQNHECPQYDRQQIAGQLLEGAKGTLQQAAANALQAVANGYFELAKKAADSDQAVDNYISFVLMSRANRSGEYGQAIAAITARDEDLSPEGIQF